MSSSMGLLKRAHRFLLHHRHMATLREQTHRVLLHHRHMATLREQTHRLLLLHHRHMATLRERAQPILLHHRHMATFREREPRVLLLHHPRHMATLRERARVDPETIYEPKFESNRPFPDVAWPFPLLKRAPRVLLLHHHRHMATLRERAQPILLHHRHMATFREREPRVLLLHHPRHMATLRERARVDPETIYEPKFESNRPFPDVESVIIRLQGYDYVPLEKFQSFAHMMAKRFDFDVVESYAVAAQNERMVLYKPGSMTVDTEIILSTYNRTLRIASMPAVRLPLFMAIMQAHVPIGVRMTMKVHEKQDDTMRYIPDVSLKAKQDELRSLDDVNVRKRLGWE